MLVSFPLALSVCTFGCDAWFWWSGGDPFWARAAMWASGVGFAIGLLAGVSGTVELLAVSGIRVRAASWTHFVIAMTLLAVLGANWGWRVADPVAAVLPFGLLLSGLAVGFAGFTGWHGGKLVFDYGLGTASTGS